MTNVLLLREPSEDSPDRYELALKAANYHPVSVPVLETVHTNITILRDIIRRGPKAQSFAGVVITSKRSCDAWKEALQLLRDDWTNHMEDRDSTALAGWCTVPFYVVGQATATALREVFLTFEDLGLRSVDVRGQSSGSAASLAKFILEDLRERPSKLLYLTGDKNRDTITLLLAEGGISLEPLQVYKTQGSPTFEDSLSSALVSSPKHVKHWWIVYFAPSAAAFVTPILRKYFHLKALDAPPDPPDLLLPAKIAAIGPTTNSFLQEELHLKVDVMAQKPTPDEIVSAIESHDGVRLLS